MNESINETTDFFMLKNKNLVFEKFILDGRCIEKLVSDNKDFVFTPVTNWHFPYVKNWRDEIPKKLISYDEWLELNKKNIGIKISKDMINREIILNHYKKFSL